MQDTTQQEELNLPEFEKPNAAEKQLTEDSISNDAIDYEASSFAQKNITKKEQKQESNDAKDEDEVSGAELTDEEKKYVNNSSPANEPDEKQDPMEFIKDMSEQPFEVAMSNLEVTEDDVIYAAKSLFSSKGYFEMEFDLPFDGHITLRSKSMNDYIDYNEYVRRLLIDEISQREFDTFTQLRNLSYCMVELDGDDFSEMSIEERYKHLLGLSDIKISAIIMHTKNFWRVSHLMLHPRLVDFLLQNHHQ